MKELPDRLSDLVALAHADLREAEESPDYRIDMLEWHAPRRSRGRRVCKVCLAGAVMAFSLGLPRVMDLTPGTLEDPIRLKLEALNHVRNGHVGLALERMRLQEEGFDDANLNHPLDRPMPAYLPGAYGTAFHDALDAVERDLREAGL